MRNYFLILLTIVFSVSSCKNREEKRGIPPTEAKENINLDKTESSSTVTFVNNKNEILYSNYLLIKQALVNTDFSSVKKEAYHFNKTLINDSIYDGARQVALLIASSSSIKKQREFFVGLTAEVTIILEKSIKKGKIHQQYCPMAFDGRGAYWLSDSNEIRNPYFGDQMLLCGEVVKVLESKTSI